MNKIQYITVLKLRGVTELNGLSLKDALEQSGGTPTETEMVIVNFYAMEHYIDKYTKEKRVNDKLTSDINELQKRDDFLTCLEAAGVDNWEGYDLAWEMMSEIDE